MKLLDQLRDYMEDNNVKVPAIQDATGIPAARIYKWLQGAAEPKTEDARKLRELMETGILPNSKKVPSTNMEKSGRDQLKDEIIALLKEKIQRLESDKIDLARLIANQELGKAYLTAIHEHLVRVRAKVEGREVGVYIRESAKLLGEFLAEGEQAHQSGKDSSKSKPYKVKV